MKSERNIKYLFSLPSNQFNNFLGFHINTVNYAITPVQEEENQKIQRNDLVFYSNEHIWNAVINNKLRRTDIKIILDNFFLFEWFPRSPGLFHTEYGENQRKSAGKYIDSYENGVIVFNPYGKASMLNGGIGSIRLKPIEIKDQLYYFVSASSNGICHEGFPLAVPEDLYNERCIDEISESGAKSCKVVGRLKFVPDNLSKLYQDYRSVPQLYIQVEDIISVKEKNIERDYYNIPTKVPPSILKNCLQLLRNASRNITKRKKILNWLWISVASSFSSDYEGDKKVYATYVTFNPGLNHSLDEAVEWMEQDYIVGKYQGKVLTDFDEQQSNFPNAPFSLEKVMNLRLNRADICSALSNFHINAEELTEHQKQIFIILGGENRMGGTYNISGGQQGAVGDNAKAENFTLQSVVVPDNLAGQIAFLRESLKKEAKKEEASGQDTTDYDEAIGIVTSAKKEIENGDESKAKSYFASAGSWLLDFATKIGASLVTEVIKQQTGL